MVVDGARYVEDHILIYDMLNLEADGSTLVATAVG